MLEARGDIVSARGLFVQSLGQMSPTLGTGHPAVQEARTRLAAHP
jgi:hypothetical protein